MKRTSWLILLLSLLVSACSSQTTPTVEPTRSPTSAAQPPAAKVNTSTPDPELMSAEPGCTVVSPQPTAGPTLRALFPPPGEGDWAKGPETAAVTILEYSDFQ